MAKMKTVQVPKAGADFEIVEREIPQPGALRRFSKPPPGRTVVMHQICV